MKCPYCDGNGCVDVLASAGPGDLDIDHEFCEDCDGTGIASAYTRSVMESARVQHEHDKPYLRMAREQGAEIETWADLERFKQEVA